MQIDFPILRLYSPRNPICGHNTLIKFNKISRRRRFGWRYWRNNHTRQPVYRVRPPSETKNRSTSFQNCGQHHDQNNTGRRHNQQTGLISASGDHNIGKHKSNKNPKQDTDNHTNFRHDYHHSPMFQHYTTGQYRSTTTIRTKGKQRKGPEQ